MTAKLEATTEKNTNDIQALALQVTRVVTIVENSEKRHEGDVNMWREAIAGISKLNESVSKTLLLEKDVAAAKETMAELKSDIRVVRHDVGNLQNAQNAIPIHQAAIAKLEAKIIALEVIRDKISGGAMALGFGSKVLWTVFGGAIIALGGYLIDTYMDRNVTTISAPSQIEITAPVENDNPQ
jgi:hypothetical protein